MKGGPAPWWRCYWPHPHLTADFSCRLRGLPAVAILYYILHICLQEGLCHVGEHQHRPAHLMFIVWQNSALTWSVKLKHNGDMGMGHLWFKWVGQLWQSELLLFFRGKYALKNSGLWGVQRDRNLWSCDDQKTLFHCSTISLFAFSSTPCQLLYQIRLFIMKEKLITHQIKMQPGRLPCLSKPKKWIYFSKAVFIGWSREGIL